MAVKMRLIRVGKTKQPSYRVVVIDGRSPRDGRYLEQVGRYDPRQEPSLVEIDNDKAVAWLQKGAQPTDRVRKLLEISGALSSYKVATGQVHTVGAQSDKSSTPSASTPSASTAGTPTPSTLKMGE